MSYSITTIDEVNDKIWSVVHDTPVFDIHSNLCDPRFDDSQIKSGIDELLTTSKLAEELFRYHPCSVSDPNEELTREEYEGLPLRLKSELIWHRLFLANTPISEATRSVLTALGLLELDPKTRNLGAYRNFFKQYKTQEHILNILDKSNIDGIINCYNPLEEGVAETLSEELNNDKFYTALDLSDIICNWKKNFEKLSRLGCKVKRSLDKNVYPVVTDYITRTINDNEAVYIYLNLPSELSFSCKSDNFSKLLTKCLIPAIIKAEIPLYLHFMDTKATPALNTVKLNSPLNFSNTYFIQEMSEKYPQLKLIVNDSNFENQHQLSLLSSRNSNILPVVSGPILSSPTLFSEIIHTRLELTGASFVPFTSDATVYEELLSQWAHSRWLIAKTLQQKYSAIYRTGWRVTAHEIEREIHNLLSENSRKFLDLN